MPEVRRGFLFHNYRQRMADWELEQGPHPQFYQEASYGLTIPELTTDQPIVIRGMHPEQRKIEFTLPEPPTLEIEIEGNTEKVAPRIHSVICHPADKMVHIVYGSSRELPRPLIPGIHKHIPIAGRVNGEPAIQYDAPTPIKEQLAVAQEAADGSQ